MQAKINSFFKSCSSSTTQTETLDSPHSHLQNLSDEEDFTKEPEIPIIYTRRASNISKGKDSKELHSGEQLMISKSKNVLNKKRKYAQFHLDLGQSDFLLHTCKTCKFKFTPGDEGDERVHKEFHKNYSHGIGFKGWLNERVISMSMHTLEHGRVILVLNDDPPPHIKKVQEVIKMMEMDLGDGWIFHKHCKVYLYISSQRVAGCLVAEPINKAYRLVSNSDQNDEVTTTLTEVKKSTPATLQFGSISLQREIIKKVKNKKESNDTLLGSIICEKDDVAALCGVRAIWVTPSNRRKHIATHLLNATRKSFISDVILEHSELAFSQPTNVGKLLASNYTKTKSFLVYKTNS